MNIKIFNIRLDNEYCLSDQNIINEFLNSVEVKLSSANFVTNETGNYWSAVVFYELKKDSKTAADESELTVEEKKIYSTLKLWRSEKAQQLMLPPYIICHNSELISIALKKPQTLKDFKMIKGFGENKTFNYGDEIISVLNAL
ncbi:HRDC domain-containing protein [Flavobacterium sp.]|uniref:HRDC domain-containing protein n=1 Tax=Flavobacterium sp. TaxID=239 RepID=UPI002C0441E1|nr:HRDC domain-containing protein [Flavobacterium sp.]HSD09099.1 HRDC domain-containing protein [Flavobacterium sp.]